MILYYLLICVRSLARPPSPRARARLATYPHTYSSRHTNSFFLFQIYLLLFFFFFFVCDLAPTF